MDNVTAVMMTVGLLVGFLIAIAPLMIWINLRGIYACLRRMEKMDVDRHA